MQLVFIDNNRIVTDSLTVAETFGKRHADVLRSYENIDCSKEFNERNFALVEYRDAKGEMRPKLLMTQDGFSFLAFGYTGKEAARFKEMYINEFNRMREQLNKPQFAIPQTMSEALRLAADLSEANEKLQTENLMLEQRVKEYEPKISYIDTILQSKDTVTITQIAKDYGLSGKALNEILHEEKVQYKLNGQWLLYAKHQDQGYTKSYTLDIIRTGGKRDVKMNTQWTQKGRLFIHEILTKRGILPYMDRKSA